MNKIIRLTLISIMLLTAIITAGCSNDTEKYNTLRMESYKIAEESLAIVKSDHPASANTDLLRAEDCANQIKKLEKNKETVQNNLSQMETIAKKDSKLASDYQKVKNETLDKINQYINIEKSYKKSYEKMHESKQRWGK